MTVMLDFIFECILDPNHKVVSLKGQIKKKATYAKTAYDMASGQSQYLWDCYGKNKMEIGQKVDEMFKEVKFPW